MLLFASTWKQNSRKSIHSFASLFILNQHVMMPFHSQLLHRQCNGIITLIISVICPLCVELKFIRRKRVVSGVNNSKNFALYDNYWNKIDWPCKPDSTIKASCVKCLMYIFFESGIISWLRWIWKFFKGIFW